MSHNTSVEIEAKGDLRLLRVPLDDPGTEARIFVVTKSGIPVHYFADIIGAVSAFDSLAVGETL